jgi:hypothetical protein
MQSLPDTVLVKEDIADIDIDIDTAILAQARAELEKARPEIEKAMAYVNSEEIQKSILEELEKARPEIEKAMAYVNSEEVQKVIREEMKKNRAEQERVKPEIERNGAEIKRAKEEIKRAKVEMEKEMMELKDKYLILLDGKEITKEEMNSIPSEHIESITILKDKSAADIHGEKAADGVIKIKLKNNTKTNLKDNDSLILLDEKEITKE